jgi:uncharacterized lipoprotein YddW (UPF0748 family)
MSEVTGVRRLAIALAALLTVITALPAAARPVTAVRELRGLWIASVANIDWPAKPGLPVTQQKADYVSLLDRARAAGVNAVFVQIRPTADSFYPSALEPWSQYLTGTQGRDPGYDPLRFLVSEAHKRDLEFHAWFNPYRISLQGDLGKLAPNHPARLHPDWVVGYGRQLYYNPGIPAVRRFVEQVILDTTRRYDIDGVHFDDYFYPYPVAGQQFPDQQTFARYGGGFADIGDWRRSNVNSLISELSFRIHAMKPWIAFGVSPFGIWRDARTDPTGSDTQGGVHDYDDLYADTRTWIRNRWVDYIAPQLYWPVGYTIADYAKLLPWWAHEVAGTGVSLYIGQAVYKIGAASPPAWQDPAEMPRHIALDRATAGVRGDILYNATTLLADPLRFTDQLRADLYARPAIVPVRPTVAGHAPPAPILLPPTGNTLHWIGFATSYAVYQDGNLLTTLRGTSLTLPAGRHSYAVTALDRTHHESRPSTSEEYR